MRGIRAACSTRKRTGANGGGSLAPGTGYLANLFFNENVNPDLGPSNPAFSAPDDFVNAFTNAFNYYNHNTTGGPYGQNIVNTYAPQYRSEERRVGKECRSRWS